MRATLPSDDEEPFGYTVLGLTKLLHEGTKSEEEYAFTVSNPCLSISFKALCHAFNDFTSPRRAR